MIRNQLVYLIQQEVEVGERPLVVTNGKRSGSQIKPVGRKFQHTSVDFTMAGPKVSDVTLDVVARSGDGGTAQVSSDFMDKTSEEPTIYKKYSVLLDCSNQSIIKFYYGRKPLKSIGNDEKPVGIASLKIVERASASIALFGDRYYLQTNFQLMGDAYGKVQRQVCQLFSRRYQIGRRGGGVSIRAEYNILMKPQGNFLLIQTPIDRELVSSIHMVSERSTAAGYPYICVRPENTAVEFNNYLFKTLLQTYDKFKGAILTLETGK